MENIERFDKIDIKHFQDGYEQALKDLILDFTKAELEGNGYDFYFAIRTKLTQQQESHKDIKS